MNDKQKKYVATNGQKIVNNKIVKERVICGLYI